MAPEHRLFSHSLPQSLWRAEVVKHQEAVLAHQQGISLYSLMEQAGLAAFKLLQCKWPDAMRILVLAGGGNNGGDALVVARLANQAGKQVKVLALGDLERMPSEAQQALAAWKAEGGQLELSKQLDWPCDAIIDGVLGIGLNSEVRAPLQALFAQVNQSGVPVLALDLPSGLSADTGKLLGCAIKASATICFIAAKQGLFTGQAPEYVGKLVFAGLGLSDLFEQQNTTAVSRADYAQLSSMLAPRTKNAHKGSCGRVALVGGNVGMAGAIRMAAEASLRTGAGLVNVFTQAQNQFVVCTGRPELMVAAVASDSLQQLDWCLAQASCKVIGPGLGQDEWAQALFPSVLSDDTACLVDADALNLLARAPEQRKQWVLTPHPGEAARLLNCSVAEIEADRIAAAQSIQRRYGGVCVLKGAGTIVAGEQGQVKICSVGNPGMASGGMGDVLSGIIGGLIAQFAAKHSLFDIACLGVCIHGMAADRAAEQGERGMLASDLMPFIRQLVNPKL
ncbi:NAD(P)H-hydrate dehydratase [Agarivorans aestuarii]|uniref:Bifunctional NAD(P)H-hydrate repair enzyme n=1 Tax=Agarivorans aestuarii TaxID=1563703 RepID=A0ABU7FZ35_9ALTE|nr:NAD(P)H-hydrate dehydratase [Agarivorans aestuarii]MEE1672287.1 NAD(P)H-hydrate dehydratase [Agarivorans aestuarii]